MTLGIAVVLLPAYGPQGPIRFTSASSLSPLLSNPKVTLIREVIREFLNDLLNKIIMKD